MATRMLPLFDVWPAATSVTHSVADELVEFTTDDVALPRYHVWTLGCQMNHSDSEEMAGALAAAGCAQAPSLESADLIVINSCAIRETAEQKVIGRMGHLHRLREANPALRVVLTGCSVRTDNVQTLHKRYPQVDLFLRPDEEPELAARLGLAGATSPGRLASPIGRESALSAWLPIIYGCDKTCTYYIVPFSRGPERSRAFDEVLNEARSLAAAGYREVTLLGQNVNSYGRDLYGSPRFAELLRAVAAAGVERVRFTTSHPKDLSDETIRAMADTPQVCRHLHLPVQSGSDRVLEAMNRHYTQESYLALVERLYDAMPDLALTTDVIVGFPGETEADFEQTMRTIEAARYDAAFTFIYSPREGTPAAAMADQVPRDETQPRFDRLVSAIQASALAKNVPLIGTVQRVLLEGPSKRDQRVLTGRTGGNKVVHMPLPEGATATTLAGTLVDVRIDDAQTWFCMGTLIG